MPLNLISLLNRIYLSWIQAVCRIVIDLDFSSFFKVTAEFEEALNSGHQLLGYYTNLN